MNDMTAVTAPKSDQINADDLIGRNMTITIREVQIKGGQEQPVAIVFDGSDKVFRPCKSMSRVLVAAWGADAKQYVGRSLTLYRDPTVKWGGMEVGGIRISHMSDIERSMTMALTATKGSRKPFVVQPLQGVPRNGPAPSGQDRTQNAQATPPARQQAPSDAGPLYRLMTETETKTFDSEGAYAIEYRRIVSAMYGANQYRELMAFDQANKPLIAGIVGLAETVAAINAEVRKPAAGGLGI